MTKDWEMKTLGDVCVISPSKSEVRKKLSDNDLVSFVPMYDMQEFSKDLILRQEKKLIDVIKSYTYFSNDDVLFAKITPCFENGKMAIASCLKNGYGFGSSEYVVLRPSACLDKNYLFYFINTDIFRLTGKKLMNGAAGHKRVPNTYIENRSIPVPSISEQKRIVKILDEKFEAVKKLKKVTQEQSANAKDLFDSRLSEVFALNEKFEQISLGNTIKLEYGKPLDQSERSSTGTYPVYGANGIKAYSEKYYCNDVGIVVGRKGSAGEVNLTDNKFWPLDVTYFVSCDPNQNDLFYIYYLLKSLKLQQYATGVKPGLNRNDVYAIKINKYSLVEQKNIVKELNELSEKTKELWAIFARKVADLEELKKSYLHEAFSGKL